MRMHSCGGPHVPPSGLAALPQAASKRASPVKTRQQKTAAAAPRSQGVYVMQASRLSRRRAVQIGAATETMRKQVMAWADKNKVDVTADFITSQGNKVLLTAAAEAQARTGHDFIPFFQWDVLHYADSLDRLTK